VFERGGHYAVYGSMGDAPMLATTDCALNVLSTLPSVTCIPSSVILVLKRPSSSWDQESFQDLESSFLNA
jgi:hypothetical protein